MTTDGYFPVKCVVLEESGAMFKVGFGRRSVWLPKVELRDSVKIAEACGSGREVTVLVSNRLAGLVGDGGLTDE